LGDDIQADSAGNAIISILMNKNRTITANFIQSDRHYSISATVEPSTGGSIQFSVAQPAGGYAVNESISVTAVAETGYVFRLWTGYLAGNENPRTLLVSENMSITAIFYPTVTVYCSPTDGGSVTLEPDSSIGYTVGTEVVLNAVAAKGYRFVAWEGDASGSDRSVTITVDEPMTLTATFAGQSSSRWWLWVIVGLAGLFGVLIVLRLVYARMKREAWDEVQPPDE
jgi:uncharacterized repeat protein (TIGR02543 family)